MKVYADNLGVALLDICELTTVAAALSLACQPWHLADCQLRAFPCCGPASPLPKYLIILPPPNWLR